VWCVLSVEQFLKSVTDKVAVKMWPTRKINPPIVTHLPINHAPLLFHLCRNSLCLIPSSRFLCPLYHIPPGLVLH